MFDRRLDNGKILAATGLSQAELTPCKEGLARELAWFKEHPYYHFLNPAENARMDRYCNSHISLKGLTVDEIAQYMEAYNGAK